MSLFKNKYRVESTRLKDWDYSSDGCYFVTICTKNQKCWFGNIVDSKMRLSNIGEVASHIWMEIPQHFHEIELDEFVVMPNHIHGIIIIHNDRDSDGRDAINRVSTGGVTGRHNPMLTNSLGKIIRWYKGKCTYEINKMKDETFFAWQSRFYDHIVGTEEAFQKVREYISDNPLKWELDEENPDVIKKVNMDNRRRI